MNLNPRIKEGLQALHTPLYLYDMDLLNQTLNSCKKESDKHGFHVHYAMKANTEDEILKAINTQGFGADCVSGNEVRKALEVGFSSDKVVFAGVGKTDAEIRFGLENDIFCFNCESVQEMEVVNQLAETSGVRARIAIRINPNVDAKTHSYITTGLDENKFGIGMSEMESVLDKLKGLNNLILSGLHFHIGSQITDNEVFRGLCIRINEIGKWFYSRNIAVGHVNVGGGLGIDYQHPDTSPIPDFSSYFNVFKSFLELSPGQSVHFELGRALVGQCGSLISRVLYIKTGKRVKFVIVDAGMNDLMRPALYGAFHLIENLNSSQPLETVDVVGPVCESSDRFGKAVRLPGTSRGDILAIRSAGAYGAVMASSYNLRELPQAYFMENGSITDRAGRSNV